MIYAEGINDATFLMALGFSKKDYRSMGGKGNVLKVMKTKSNVKGLVDEDAESVTDTTSKVYQPFKVQDINSFRAKLFLKSNNNFLLVLRPDFERWFLTFVKQANVDLKSLGLSPAYKDFKGEITTPANKKKFTQIVQDHLGHTTLIEIKDFLS